MSISYLKCNQGFFFSWLNYVGMDTYIYIFSHRDLKGLAFAFAHGLRTPNEGINQRNPENFGPCGKQNVSAGPKNLGLGFDCRLCSEGDFLTGGP